MSKEGFDRVNPVLGGFETLIAAGFPIEP